MSPLASAVLAAILAGPVRGDPSPVLPELAEAIAEIAETPEGAAALVAVARAETFFADYVLRGRCHEGPPGERCDPDRNGNAQALGPWQLHSWCGAPWSAVVHGPALGQLSGAGVVDYASQAACAWGRLRWGRRECGSWPGALNVYGGRACDSTWSRRREASRQAALATIWRELARSE